MCARCGISSGLFNLCAVQFVFSSQCSSSDGDCLPEKLFLSLIAAKETSHLIGGSFIYLVSFFNKILNSSSSHPKTLGGGVVAEEPGKHAGAG